MPSHNRPQVRPRDPRDLYQRALGASRPLVLGADAKPKRRRITRGSRPNAGLEALYRERLERLVAEMAKSVLYWTKAIYRANEPPTMAMDGKLHGHLRSSGCDSDSRGHGDSMDSAMDYEPPTVTMAMDENHELSNSSLSDQTVMGVANFLAFDRKTAADRITEAFDKLKRRWLKQFDEAAPKLARWFAIAASKRSDATLQRILRDGGFSVKFQMTPAARNIIDAAVAENVSLIKSIPSQYFTQVEGAVMRSVRQGGDLGTLAKELRSQYGVTKRRAAFIAKDQNAKATADMTKARQIEKGYKAIWRHSHAGKTPRPTHVAQDGKTYDPAAGWLDPAINKRIWPGTEPGCRCITQTIIPGFEP